MILLDTNVLSELTRARPAPQVVAWLEENEPLLALPAITLAELRYGIARLAEGRRKSSLIQFWDLTRERFVGRIFSFDDRAAEAYGDIVAAAERAGRPINVADGLIAAIALVHGTSIATRDIGDFDVTGAPLDNPWDFTVPGRSWGDRDARRGISPGLTPSGWPPAPPPRSDCAGERTGEKRWSEISDQHRRSGSIKPNMRWRH